MSMSYEELESERQYSEWRLEKLQRCLENDYGIRASWDGLRRVWTTESVTTELDYIEDKSRWFELFGTPERAAKTLRKGQVPDCNVCAVSAPCRTNHYEHCLLYDYNALVEWLKEGVQ